MLTDEDRREIADFVTRVVSKLNAWVPGTVRKQIEDFASATQKPPAEDPDSKEP